MLDENKLLVQLTVKEFRELLPKEEEKEEFINTDELMNRLVDKDGNPCTRRRIYSWTHQGMKVAKRGYDR